MAMLMQELSELILQLVLAIVISKDFTVDDIIDVDLTINIENIMNGTLFYDDIEKDDGISRALFHQLNQKQKEYKERRPRYMDSSVYQRFTEGFLTVRRSDKLSFCTPMDIVIEQSMMKFMCDITRGRSPKKSVISKWDYSMHAMNTVLKHWKNIKTDITDQHVDASDSRGWTDAEDVQNLVEWFSSHNPFLELNNLISIATEVVGKDKIKCLKLEKLEFPPCLK